MQYQPTLESQLGLTPMFAVGFCSATCRPVVYKVYVQTKSWCSDEYVDKLNAAYDGKVIRPLAVTANMIMRGTGLRRIPMYAMCHRVEDAERYADDLMVVVQRKTTNNIKVLARDTSTITKRMWKEMTKGLWSIPVPEWH